MLESIRKPKVLVTLIGCSIQTNFRGKIFFTANATLKEVDRQGRDFSTAFIKYLQSLKR